MVKYVSIFLFLGVCYFKSNCQDNTKYRIYCNPIGFQVGNSNIDEYGEGVYELKNTNRINLDIGFLVSKRINKTLFFEFGIGLKKLNYAFKFTIPDPFDPNTIFLKEKRFNDRLVISPHLGLQFIKNKIFISASAEPNLALFSNSNFEGTYAYSPLYIFLDPVTQKSAYFSYTEGNFYTNKLFLFLTPKISFSYSISKNLYLGVDFLIRPFGQYYLYQWLVEGKTAEMPDGLYTLNDSRVNNKMVYAFLSISYFIDQRMGSGN
jgi:hypothetical protein